MIQSHTHSHTHTCPSSRSPVRVLCVLFHRVYDRTQVHAFAEACLRFTPQIALRAEEAVFLEIGGSARLFPEHQILSRLAALLRRFRLQASVEINSDASSALACARYRQFTGHSTVLPKLPIDFLSDILTPFRGDEEETKKISQVVETLKKLGIQSFLDFSRLPSKTLASRLGKRGLRLIEKARQRTCEPWPRFTPSEILREDVALDFAATADLSFIGRPAVDRLMLRLKGRAHRLCVLGVEMQMENYSTLKSRTRKWRIHFPLPQGSAAAVMPILHERLHRSLEKEPLEAPVCRLRFEAEETVPGQGTQRDFFSKKEEELEKWHSLIARLAEKLGPERVFVAAEQDSHRPEKAWKKMLFPVETAAPAEPPTKIPPRPLRLLKTPARLEKEGTLLKLSSRHWKTLQWDGPERLSGEWWDSYFERDYFKVQTESGSALWVYSEARGPGPDPGAAAATGPQQEFFLHGYFD